MKTQTVQNPLDQEINVGALQRRTLIVLIVSQVIGTIGVGVAPSIGVLLAGEVTDNEAWAGLARTASTLGAAVMGIPLGNLAAAKGRRVALSTGWGIATVGGAILVAAAQWHLVVPLFIGLFLFGAGSAVTLQARFAATDLAAPANKARALSLVVWVGTLGMVLGPNLGTPGALIGQLTGLSTYSAAFLIATVFSVVAALLVFVFLRPDPMLTSDALLPQAHETPEVRKRGAISGIIEEMRVNRPARNAVIAIVTAQIVMVSVMTMTPVHVIHHSDSVSLVGITISLHILGMYALAPVVGSLTDRYGNRFTIAIGTAIFAASLIIGVFWAANMTLIVMSLVLLGLGWSFVNVSASALFSRVVSSETRASSQGGVDALSNLFGATTAFAAGPLMAATSFSVLSIVGLVFLIPLLFVLLEGRQRGKRRA